jgi:hypothetical protein
MRTEAGCDSNCYYGEIELSFLFITCIHLTPSQENSMLWISTLRLLVSECTAPLPDHVTGPISMVENDLDPMLRKQNIRDNANA